MWTGHRPEIADLKEAVGLRFQGMEDVSYSNTAKWIVVTEAAPGEGHWLVINTQHGGMFQSVPEDVAYLSKVHIMDNGRDQYGI